MIYQPSLDVYSEDHDRVRHASSPETNRKIDTYLEDCVRYYADRPVEEISRRILDLDREKDVDQVMELIASGLTAFGLYKALLGSKRWLVLPALVIPFLLQYSLKGWSPPVSILRRFGIRTRREIDREKFALKALRGDFDSKISNPTTQDRASMAILGVKMP